jgi:hypothetical protein
VPFDWNAGETTERKAGFDWNSGQTVPPPETTISALPKPGLVGRLKGMVTGNVWSDREPLLSRLTAPKPSDPNLAAVAKEQTPIQQAPLLSFEAAVPERGIARGVASFASGLTSPENAALMVGTGAIGRAAKSVPAAAAGSRAVSALFGTSMATGALAEDPEINDPDPAIRREAWTRKILGGAMAGMAIKHAARPTPIPKAAPIDSPGPVNAATVSDLSIRRFDPNVTELRNVIEAGQEGLRNLHSGKKSAEESAETFRGAPVDAGPVRKGPLSAEESARVFAENPDLPPDAGPVRKGIRPAQESAAVFQAELPELQSPDAGPVRKGGPIKPAQESWGVFKAGMGRERPIVPETGIPEGVARASDARDRIALELKGRRFSELDNPDRIVIDDLIAEGYGSAIGTRSPAEPSRPPALASPGPVAPPARVPPVQLPLETPAPVQALPPVAPPRVAPQPAAAKVEAIPAQVPLETPGSVRPPAPPFMHEGGTYKEISRAGGMVKYEFTRRDGTVNPRPVTMPEAKFDQFAKEGDAVAPAKPVPEAVAAPEVPPAAPAPGGEPVVPGGGAAAGDAAGGGAKQPWEMTGREFSDWYNNPQRKLSEMQKIVDGLRGEVGDIQPRDLYSETGKKFERMKQYEEGMARVRANPEASFLRPVEMEAQRRGAVQEALRSGQPVPPEVLADYPDLAPPPGPASAPPRVVAPPQGGSGLPLAPGERPPSQRGAVTFGEKVPVSPNYEESKVKIPDQFRISPQAQSEFAKTLADWERETPERRAVSFAEVEERAAAYPDEILRKLQPPETGKTLDPAVRVAASRMVSRFMDEIAARRKALTDKAPGMDQASVMKEEAEIGRIEQDARRTSDVLIRARSQDGRNLRYYYDMAKGDLDQTVWLAQAKKAVGLPANVPIPDKVYQTVSEAVTEARQVVAKARASGNANVDTVPAVVAAKLKLSKVMAKLEESGWWETLTALRKAGLLTGLKTHARNIFGNSAFQVMEEAAKFPASLIDIGLSWKTGERTVTGISLRAVQSASRKASTDGVKQAYEILKNGATPEQLLKGEVYREVNFQGLGKASKIINVYANSVFRTLAAEDQVFRAYGVERSIQAQAKVLALNEARSKQIAQADVLKRTRYLTQNPTEAMALQAIEDAEFATFNNKNWVATGFSSMKTSIKTSAASLEGKRHHLGATAGANALLFGIDWVVPFVRTPLNIGARMFDYTLGAPIKTIFHATTAMARGLTPERQHAISQAIGRGSIGWGLMLLGYYKASQGEATGVGKKDPNQRNVSEAVGEQPGAILLGGKWRKISPLSPGGNIIAMGASLYERGSSMKTAGFVGDVWQVGGQTLLDQPMLQGPSEFMDVLKDPERRGQKFISSAAGSVVPTVVSDIATATDPTRREYPTGPIEGLASRMPGVRTTLPEKYDVLGRPLEASRMTAIDPFLSKTAKAETSPVDRELAKHNIGIGKPPKPTAEDADEYRLRMAVRGRYILESLNGLVADPEYPSATDAEKKASLKIAVREGAMNFAREWREFASDSSFQNAAKPQRVERLQEIIALPQ